MKVYELQRLTPAWFCPDAEFYKVMETTLSKVIKRNGLWLTLLMFVHGACSFSKRRALENGENIVSGMASIATKKHIMNEMNRWINHYIEADYKIKR